MLEHSFELQLNQVILKGLATIGKYDGKHPALTCGTSSGQVFMHTPHDNDDLSNQIKFLKLNKDITALTSGCLDQSKTTNPDKRDVLLVGSSTNLLSYDVEKNADLFYREIQDGLNVMKIAQVSHPEPLVLVGGNCSIQGYDAEGEEQFWTTTGGNVLSLEVMDVDEDGVSEMLVGSDDYSIYIYQDEAVLSEVTETEMIHGLTDLGKTRYGYALMNGTVGVYDNEKRLWRNKSKNTVNAIEGYDLDGDGVPELITGWANGKVEVYHQENGDLVFKDRFKHPISAVLKSDYRMNHKEEIIVCAHNGDIRGYSPRAPQPTDRETRQSKMEAKLLAGLRQERDNLLYEIQNYEENIKRIRGRGGDSSLINPLTKVQCHLKPNPEGRCVDVVFTSSEDTCIKAAFITAEHLFETDSRLVYADVPSNTIHVGLKPKRDKAIEMKIQVLVGHAKATQFHVFQLEHDIPKFSMYLPVNTLEKSPKGSVRFKLQERLERVVMWLNTSFNIVYQHDNKNFIDVKFISLRDGSPVRIYMKDDQMSLDLDNMDIAGEMVEDLANHMKIRELDSIAEFPQEFEAFQGTLSSVDSYNKTRLKMSADMADATSAVKAFVIKAEDSRILGNMGDMRNVYKELYEMNQSLIGEYTKRSNNHKSLLSALKDVNSMIQKAARLRVGSHKTRVVHECRAAVKKNNVAGLFKIIKYGSTDVME
mmetsp:Transcript_199/g.341  ORF Transcript_199/g.341 Transcript_199/m.341 type:complete len:704 (-) Transcript_199:10-2121(-)